MPKPPQRKIEFAKQIDGRTARCMVELFDDGSVYVAVEDYEVIFEFAPDNLANATDFLGKLGYRRVSDAI
ncbi:MAG: hypothetical protein U1D30_03035 [Planctomycetota bacterium]